MSLALADTSPASPLPAGSTGAKTRPPESCVVAAAPHTVPRSIRVFDCCIIALLAGFLLFWNLGADSFTPNDETQHVLVTQMMLQKGKWWDLSIGGRPYYGKPPFKMWLSTIPVTLFGQSNFTFRSLDATFGVLTCLLTYLLALRFFRSRLAGYLGVALLLGSKGFVISHVARNAVQDSILVFLFTASMWIGWEILLRISPVHQKYRETWERTTSILPLAALLGVAVGAAAMSKSIAAYVVLFVLGSYALVSGDFKTILRRSLFAACIVAILAIAIPAPYFTYRCLQHEEMCRGIFATRVVNRAVDVHYSGGMSYWRSVFVHGAAVPPELLGIAILVAAYFIIRNRDRRYLFLSIWCFGTILFYTLSKGKFSWYIAPAFPAMALLVGQTLSLGFSSLGALRTVRQNVLAVPLVVALALMSSHLHAVWTRVSAPPREIPMNQVATAVQRAAQTRPDSRVVMYEGIGVTLRERVYINTFHDRLVIAPRRKALAKALAAENVTHALIPAGMFAFASTVRTPTAYMSIPGSRGSKGWLIALDYTSGAPSEGFSPVVSEILPDGSADQFFYGWNPPTPFSGLPVRLTSGPTSSLIIKSNYLLKSFGGTVRLVLAQVPQPGVPPAVVSATLNSVPLGAPRVVPRGDFGKLDFAVPPALWRTGPNMLELHFERAHLSDLERNSLFASEWREAIEARKLKGALLNTLRGSHTKLRDVVRHNAPSIGSQGELPPIGERESVALFRSAFVIPDLGKAKEEVEERQSRHHKPSTVTQG